MLKIYKIKGKMVKLTPQKNGKGKKQERGKWEGDDLEKCETAGRGKKETPETFLLEERYTFHRSN